MTGQGTRRAEIAGAGFAGLTAAAALARRGWAVTVRERSPEIRSTGAGIYIYENGLRVLEALDAADGALRGAVRVTGRRVTENGRTVSETRLPPGQRVHCVARQRLVEALADAARRAGAEIVLNAETVSAAPEGRLTLADGSFTEADLVVAADGVGSRIRDALGLLKSSRRLPDGATRVMAARVPQEEDDPGMVVEAWAGVRRVLYTPCTEADVYLALCARDDDAGAVATPVDTAAWSGWFPDLAPMIGRIAGPARYDRFGHSTLSRWSAGRVAILGDAAHAMPPNIGQGAGCSMMNALALAAWLDRDADIPGALAAWERAQRPLTAHAQRVSLPFGLPATWPAPLRSAFFALAGRSGAATRWRTRAARAVPDGTDLPPRAAHAAA